MNSPVLVQIGGKNAGGTHDPNDPTLLSDVFFRIGGAEPGRATTSLVVNADNAILDDIWAWRADHGAGVGWNSNTADTGVVVNGDNVSAYGLFVEHYQKFEVIWNGQNGEDVFFQNEMPYDPPSQAAWMSTPTTDGYAAFLVSPNVTSFQGYGMGSYSFFNQGIPIFATQAFQAPTDAGRPVPRPAHRVPGCDKRKRRHPVGDQRGGWIVHRRERRPASGRRQLPIEDRLGRASKRGPDPGWPGVAAREGGGYGDAMDVGIHFMNFTLSGGPDALRAHVRDTAEAAEAAGCTMFTCMDHYFQMEAFTRAEDPMLEGYTTLGYVAARTETMTLGLLVTGVSYRYPGLLAKIVTTLDVLSGGRAMLGIGAAWYEREHVGLGVPFYPIAERLERLEETLQICLQMWSDDDGPYEGKHYQLGRDAERAAAGRGVHDPPILIGGGGERKLLRLVAKYADMNNLFSPSPEQVQHKLDVLARHCEDVGRDRSEIRTRRSGASALTPTSTPSSRRWRRSRALGMEHVQLSLLTDEPARLVAGKVAEIVPRLTDLKN